MNLVRGRKLAGSPRSHVWEGRLDGEKVVVKRVAGDAEFDRELAALQLAAAPGVVPRVLAADPDRRELVVEFLPHEPPRPG